MTDIGRSTTDAGATIPEMSALSVRGEMPRVSEPTKPDAAKQHKHGLWESLTASLDLACRGYLCMQIVDCDPVSDPDCSAAGTKVVIREVPGVSAGAAQSGDRNPESRGSQPLQRSS